MSTEQDKNKAAPAPSAAAEPHTVEDTEAEQHFGATARKVEKPPVGSYVQVCSKKYSRFVITKVVQLQFKKSE